MSKKLILIIEDDFETQFLFSEFLRSMDYDVEVASHGGEAITFLEDSAKRIPDLILMDLNFPHMTPEQFVANLKASERSKDIPFIIVSGRAEIEDYAERLKASNFIKKPFDIDEVIDLISATI